MSGRERGARRGERRADRDEKRLRRREQALAAAGGAVREDCPCPKTSCVNYGLCAPCRKKHRKSAPFCERDPK